MKGTALKRLMGYLFSRQRGKITIVLVSNVIGSLTALAAPMVLAEAIDHIADGIHIAITEGSSFQINLQTMGLFIAALLALYLLNFAFKYLEQYLMAFIAETVCLHMRKDLSNKMGRMPLRFYDSTEKGEILSRATNDIEKIGEVLREGLGQLITSLITMIGSIVMMIYISPVFTVISVITIGVATGVTALITKRSRKNFYENQVALGRVNANIEEAFTGQLVIKAFSREKMAIKEFDQLNNTMCEASHKSQVSMFVVSPAVRLINSIGYTVIAVLGGISILQGRLSIGTVQAYIQYLDRAGEPLIECAFIWNMMQSAIASGERIFEIIDMDEEPVESEPREKIENLKGDVTFQHVRFGYSKGNPLMQDVNIRVKSGDKVAIVGPTGAGKTTLVNLLMRFYDIQGGKITIDGVDIRSLRRADLRKMFGMVLQDAWLFGGSIRENIAYGKSDATEEKIIKASKAARMDHFIRTMPEGYDTVLEEDGTNLSQGQRQLLTIARVILANPSLLILDEATSSVDTRTELEIQKAMDHLMRGRTSFIIAHRLSTIRDADLILVMNHGTIIEQGTHTELLAKKGFYENLYQSQFAYGNI
ncbi:MAG TPA: ABC transporter ATP-binding protein/permease [Firmicutes bacterium]|nr:ABC transporter ATP-binding protein/permease [Bacillota bacterium]